MLLRAMHSSDPTAIIGLPLITVAEVLRAAGFDLP
jgi:predicted house-cleaning NTP pyrophosphatase (Maf/HAM1 superfamily)